MIAWLKMHWCIWRHHKLHVKENLSSFSQRVACDTCGGDYAVNHFDRIVLPWDQELADFYATRRNIDQAGLQ